jgi:hypothetical protein
MAQWENAFFLLDPARKSSCYCQKLKPEERQNLSRTPDWSVWRDRYRWLNGVAFSRHGTVELRLMGGTLDELDVLGWVTFLLYCFDRTVNHGVDGCSMLQPEPDGNGHELLNRMFAALGDDGSKRCKLAFAWALKRYANTRQKEDLAAIRERRRLNRIAAWRGQKPFEPVFAPAVDTSLYAGLDVSAAFS